MYSYNDWRSYELYHASAFPGKGFIKGKNTPEYNKWYYMTHPEKWGITKAAVGMYDKAKEFANNTETDLDDRFLDAVGEGANRLKTGLKNNSAVQDVRRSTEALQRRDTARRNAEAERAGAKNAERGRDAASSASSSAGRRAKQLDNEAQFHTRNANNYSRQANQESANADAYARRARNTVGNAVRNTVGSAVGAARNAGQRILDATTIDEKLGNAAGALRRGDFRGAASSARAAGREAGERLGNAARNTGRRVLDSTNLDERAADAIGLTARRERDAAREAEANARSSYNEHARLASDARGRMTSQARETGDPVGAQNAYRGEISRRDLAADLARQNVSSAQRNRAEAENRYNQTLLGRAESGLRRAGDAITGAGRNALDTAGRGVGAVVGGARALGQRALDATNIDENISNAVGVAKNHATNAIGVAKNTVQNYRGLAENNRQIAEQGYKYGQALANAQREYDASPNPNSKRMLDIAQRDYDNYTKGNRVAQIGAAAGRAGKSLNNAMNDVQRAVGNQVESIRDRNAAARDLETARENEANARSNYNELARQSSNARGRMMDRAEETGDPVSAQNAFRDEISRRDARADEARESIPAAQSQTREAEGAYNRAQDRYDQTPLGRAENAARNLKNSAGTAVEAKIEATRAVKDAVSDYWDAVDKYGANSPQAKAAATAAEGKMSSAAVGIIGRFGNAKNTIEGVIEDGQEMMDRLLRRGD